MLLQLENEDGVDIKQYQKYIEVYPYYEDMEDLVVNDQSKNHLIIEIYDNEGERDEEKYLMYSKRWYLYTKDKYH